MKKKKYVDIISSILLITLGVVYFYASTQFPEALTVEPLGPGGFPQFMAVILVALSAYVLVKAVLDRSEDANSATKFTRRDLGCLLVMMGALVLYVVLMRMLGYAVSTFLFSAACFSLLGATWKKPLSILLPSAAMALVCYLLFKVLFRADLPSGFLI